MVSPRIKTEIAALLARRREAWAECVANGACKAE